MTVPDNLWPLIVTAFGETLQMVTISALVAAVLGIPLGVLLTVTARGGVAEQIPLNRVLGAVVNATRSTPFIILMVAIIPFTRLIVHTSIGTSAAIVPLAVAAIPFLARLVESGLREVPGSLVEAARAMGASPLQIAVLVLVPEALPAIVAAFTVTFVSLIGYSAMAGAIGGGGLGDLGIRYGYERFEPAVMLVTVAVLIALVQLVQMLGDRVARRLSHR
jgi:D-methionine transport system permease protein